MGYVDISMGDEDIRAIDCRSDGGNATEIFSVHLAVVKKGKEQVLHSAAFDSFLGSRIPIEGDQAFPTTTRAAMPDYAITQCCAERRRRTEDRQGSARRGDQRACTQSNSNLPRYTTTTNAEVSAIFSLGCCEVAQASSVHLGRSRCVGAAELLSTLV